MPTQSQYNVTLQRVREIDCKIAVLDYDYMLIDEISGYTESISFNVEADSDVRRTADISMNLKDDISMKQNAKFYWNAGNPYWFDKFIQIYTATQDIRTGEDVWVNQGIYCVNSPSITYDAISNSLSFQAVDLMAKMTGMRNGQLEGMTYSIPAGSSITGAIEGILLEQGFYKYILYTPPQETTPEDINIDAGGTAWDLLTQLRDINANWEMFFDVDGVFHFQQIPSGKVLINSNSALRQTMLVTANDENFITSSNQQIEVYTEEGRGVSEYGEPQPLVDHTIWDKLLISADYDTSFEDVKNCVEVLGKVHNANEFATTEISGSGTICLLTLSQEWEHYLNNEWTIEFAIIADESGAPVALAHNVNNIYIYDKDNQYIGYLDISKTPIIQGNEEYCLTMSIGEHLGTMKLEYIGYMQPRAVAIENNPESPFYIGTSTQYTCKTGNPVEFADEREIVVSEVDGKITNGVIYVDVSPWLSNDEFNDAEVGTEWLFRVHAKLPVDTTIISMVFTGGGDTVVGRIKNMQNQYISLDYSQDYMLVVARGSSSTPVVGMMYYPTPASLLPMSTTSEINMPKFNNQVRYVCTGDEYDNIYSNDLAEQRARYEIYLRSRLHDNITITCVPIYWLDVNQIIEYNLTDPEAHDLWLIKSISTDFSVDGTQTITAMRYYPLYADITLENLATQE